MAGNFWQSSHCHQWLLDKHDLIRGRQDDLKLVSEDDYQKIMIVYINCLLLLILLAYFTLNLIVVIQAVAEALKIRQQVIATATIFFKRFYIKNSLRHVDPLLLCPTALYLASKVDEYGVLSNTRLIQTCTNLVRGQFNYAFGPQEFQYRITHVWECEFYLLEFMDCCLIVYHPYRPLQQYVHDLCTTDETQLLQVAWRVVNDMYRTDIPLLYPPYMIALTALQFACVINHKENAKTWFAELSVDMDKILEISKQLVALYELWKSYDERKEISTILKSIPKPVLNDPSSQNNSNNSIQTDIRVSQT